MVIVKIQELKKSVRIYFDEETSPLTLTTSKVGKIVGYGDDFFVGEKNGEYNFFDINGNVYNSLSVSTIGVITEVTKLGFSAKKGRKTLEYDSKGCLSLTKDSQQVRRKGRKDNIIDVKNPMPILSKGWGYFITLAGLFMMIICNGERISDVPVVLFDILLFVGVFYCLSKNSYFPVMSIIGLILILVFLVISLFYVDDSEPEFDMGLIIFSLIISILIILPLSVSFIHSFSGRIRTAGILLLLNFPAMCLSEMVLETQNSIVWMLIVVLSGFFYYASFAVILCGLTVDEIVSFGK